MKNLLLISCSQRKKKTDNPISAWDLYDGVIYRVLKKNLIDFTNLDVLILSAKYGLIQPQEIITWYDQKMTRKRAVELKSEVEKTWKKINVERYKNIFVCLGVNYRYAMPEEIYSYILIEGGIGMKMQRIKKIIRDY